MMLFKCAIFIREAVKINKIVFLSSVALRCKFMNSIGDEEKEAALSLKDLFKTSNFVNQIDVLVSSSRVGMSDRKRMEFRSRK